MAARTPSPVTAPTFTKPLRGRLSFSTSSLTAVPPVKQASLEPLRFKEKDEALLPSPVPATPKKEYSTENRIIDAFWILLNGIMTVFVVFLNKATFMDPELRKCQITFAIWHFLATFIVLQVANLGPTRLFEPVKIPLRGVLPVCILFASFLVLNNLSLTHNNVGFYQLAKIMTVPSVVFFNYVLFRRKVSRSKLLCVVVACLGVGLANGVSAQSNPFGATMAILAFCATALYQIWIGKSLQDLNVSAPQLLLKQTLISCGLLTVFTPFFDSTPDFEKITTSGTLCFILSGFVAATVNLSQFYIIGRTSALAFNVASTAKTIAVLGIGWYAEGKVLSFDEAVGVGLALSGAFMYAQAGK